jgi:hypothetical protein
VGRRRAWSVGGAWGASRTGAPDTPARTRCGSCRSRTAPSPAPQTIASRSGHASRRATTTRTQRAARTRSPSRPTPAINAKHSTTHHPPPHEHTDAGAHGPPPGRNGGVKIRDRRADTPNIAKRGTPDHRVANARTPPPTAIPTEPTPRGPSAEPQPRAKPATTVTTAHTTTAAPTQPDRRAQHPVSHHRRTDPTTRTAASNPPAVHERDPHTKRRRHPKAPTPF